MTPRHPLLMLEGALKVETAFDHKSGNDLIRLTVARGGVHKAVVLTVEPLASPEDMVLRAKRLLDDAFTENPTS